MDNDHSSCMISKLQIIRFNPIFRDVQQEACKSLSDAAPYKGFSNRSEQTSDAERR